MVASLSRKSVSGPYTMHIPYTLDRLYSLVPLLALQFGFPLVNQAPRCLVFPLNRVGGREIDSYTGHCALLRDNSATPHLV